MKLRRRRLGKENVAEIMIGTGWKRMSGVAEVEALIGDARTDDLLPLLALDTAGRERLLALGPHLPDADTQDGTPIVPVVATSFRDFMLFEDHVINAARGMVRRLMPGVFPITRLYEAVLRKPFARFKPHKLWYQQPIYYLGNHLNIVTEGDPMPWPAYTDLLDYELEIGVFLSKPLFNATPAEAEAAIGGFVVLNDFSARDVQIDEMMSGFGPQKAKHFCSAVSSEIVTADEVLKTLDGLTGCVCINGEEVATVSASGWQFTMAEAIAATSLGQRLHPGELFGSGTLPGGAGVENDALVSPGDTLTVMLEGIGSLSNVVGRKGI